MYTSWLVGGFELNGDATIVMNDGDDEVVIPAGNYYLDDSEDAQSLVAALQEAIASVQAGTTVYVCGDRKVRIDFNGVIGSIAFPASLREVLGFTETSYEGSLSALAAEKISTLLWSPGQPETTSFSPIGVAGRRVFDRAFTASPTGLTTDTTVHHFTTMIDLAWFAVEPARAWTTAEEPGEYMRFFYGVIVPGRRFKHYSLMVEDGTTNAVTWASTVFGPYVVPNPDYDFYVRFDPRTDTCGANIELKAIVTSDFY
jgi:hypothetical protein